MPKSGLSRAGVGFRFLGLRFLSIFCLSDFLKIIFEGAVKKFRAGNPR